jgi:hypothetical protein
MDVNTLKLELERSRTARLRPWVALGEPRTILAAAGQELPKTREKSFVLEGEILERALKKALADREGFAAEEVETTRSEVPCLLEAQKYANRHQRRPTL